MDENNTTKLPDTNANEKVVWIACRATKECEGNQAAIVFDKQVKDGMMPMGRSIRYRCLTCGRPFHIHR